MKKSLVITSCYAVSLIISITSFIIATRGEYKQPLEPTEIRITNINGVADTTYYYELW